MSTGTARREGTQNEELVTASSKRETVAPVIIGEGWRQVVSRGNTRRYFELTSRSVPGMLHVVYLHSDGHLDCDCPGFYYRSQCAHCQIVSIRLAEELRCAGAEEEEWSCALTEKGRAYLAQWRREQARRAEEEYLARYETACFAEEWR